MRKLGYVWFYENIKEKKIKKMIFFIFYCIMKNIKEK